MYCFVPSSLDLGKFPDKMLSELETFLRKISVLVTKNFLSKKQSFKSTMWFLWVQNYLEPEKCSDKTVISLLGLFSIYEKQFMDSVTCWVSFSHQRVSLYKWSVVLASVWELRECPSTAIGKLCYWLHQQLYQFLCSFKGTHLCSHWAGMSSCLQMLANWALHLVLMLKWYFYSVCFEIFNNHLKIKCSFSIVSFVDNFNFDFCTFRKPSLSMVPLLFKIGLCQEAQFTGNFGFSMC